MPLDNLIVPELAFSPGDVKAMRATGKVKIGAPFCHVHKRIIASRTVIRRCQCPLFIQSWRYPNSASVNEVRFQVDESALKR